MKPDSVIVAHPTRQHAPQLAYALHNSKSLRRMYTAQPDRESLGRFAKLLESTPIDIQRLTTLALPRKYVRINVLPFLMLVFSRFLPTVGRAVGELAAWELFDRWVAGNLRGERTQALVGYEMCCAESFALAKKLGILCVLDCAAVHYSLQDDLIDEVRRYKDCWWEKKIRERKRRELALADHIICVSDLAAESYRRAGVTPDRITINPVGCDTSAFVPGIKSHDSTAKFAFVGAPGPVKAVNTLLMAFDRLATNIGRCELHFFGESSNITAEAARRWPEVIHLHGKVSHRTLAPALSKMDALILPSRIDSFGMVVTEALAAGTYVVVSEMVGAKEAVTPGSNGEIVKVGSVDDLYEAMCKILQNLDWVRSRTGACRASALNYDWSRYRDRAVRIFQNITAQ